MNHKLKGQMRVCFIAYRINEPVTGGEIYNDTLLKAAELAGYKVEKWEGITYDKKIKNKLLRLLFLNILFLVKTSKLSQTDLLLVDTEFCFRYIVALIFARHLKRIRVIGVLHHFNFLLMNKSFFHKYTHLIAESFISKRLDYLIVNSQFSLRNFNRITYATIPYTQLTPFSRESKVCKLKRAKYYDNCLKMLQVGTIEDRKNILFTTIAVSLIDVPFTLNYVGRFFPNEYFNKCVELVKSKSLNDKVFFKGSVTNEILEKFFSESSIFILVSKFEAYGMVYAEAMMYGLPIIGSTTGSVPELVIDGENGYLCDPDNPQQIADAIMKLTDKDNWKRISNNNLQKAAELMDKETFTNISVDLFKYFQTWYPSRIKV